MPVDYSNQDKTNTDLSGADLSGGNFTNTIASGVNFTNAIITNAVFKNTLITGANISTLTFSDLQKGYLLLRALNHTITAVNNLTALTPAQFRTIQPAVSLDSMNMIQTVTVKIPNTLSNGNYTIVVSPLISQIVCIFVANTQNIVIATSSGNVRTIRRDGAVVQDVSNSNATLGLLQVGSVSYSLTAANGDGVIAMIPVNFNVYQVNGSGLGDVIAVTLGAVGNGATGPTGIGGTGPTGSTGPGGAAGSAGAAGVAGSTGPTGPGGAAGVAGSAGAAGVAGSTGPTGPGGAAGVAGSAGAAGVAGSTGPTGPGGAAGVAGSAGAAGVAGSTGPTGPGGAAGAAGSAGAAGVAGSTGPTGPGGAAGAAGSAGSAGVAGSTGPTGPGGAAGVAGSAGAAGVAGSTGPTGPGGAAGAAGSAGSAGVAGSTGPTGPGGAAGTIGPTGPAGSGGGGGGSTGPTGVTGPAPTFSTTLQDGLLPNGNFFGLTTNAYFTNTQSWDFDNYDYVVLLEYRQTASLDAHLRYAWFNDTTFSKYCYSWIEDAESAAFTGEVSEPILIYLNVIKSTTGPMDVNHYIKVTFTRPKFSTNTILGHIEHSSNAKDNNGYPNRTYKTIATTAFSSSSVTTGNLSSNLTFYISSGVGANVTNSAVANQGYCKIMRKPRAESGGEFQTIGATGPTGVTGPAPAINIVAFSAYSSVAAAGYGPTTNLVATSINGSNRYLIPFQNTIVNSNGVFTIDANKTFITLPTAGTYRVVFNGVTTTSSYVGVDVILCLSSTLASGAINLMRPFSGGGTSTNIAGSTVFTATAGQRVAFAVSQGTLYAAQLSPDTGPESLPQINIELIGGNGPTGAAGSTGPIGATDYVLWASGQVNTSAATSTLAIDFTSVGKIDLDLYNIHYEVEINWNRLPTSSAAGFIYLGFNNNVYSRSYTATNNAMTTWTNNIEQNGAISAFDQRFNRQFLCGYTSVQGIDIRYRYRTNLEGYIQMQTRKTGQSTPDLITDSRMLVNRIQSDAILQYSLSSSSPYLIEFFTSPATPLELDPAHQQIKGSALWETTAGSLWTANSNLSMSNGIYQLLFRFSNLTDTLVNREFNANYRIYRIKK